MYFGTLSLLSFLFLQHALAEQIVRDLHQRKILARQLDGDESYCYGGDDAPCGIANNLYDQCGTWTDDQNTKCICENGYVTSETE